MIKDCPNCGHELIWGGDHNAEDADDKKYIESNFSCNDCGTFVHIYVPEGDE
jgi:predicted RNA-binding Zn-ribbon protein involved in translation (DUF1610 family)